MSIITLHDVCLTVANNCILDHVDWQIEPKARIALVGRNGAGKSTFLKLLQGELVQDSGQVHQRNGLRVAGLTQDVPLSQDETVYHFLVSSLGERGRWLATYRLATLNNDLTQLGKAQQHLDDLQAWELIPQIDAMASRLGLPRDDKVSTLSGGMKRRALLAAALIAEPDLLLLDEPTNHLDLQAIEWLESYLKTYSGSLVVVTHDRAFLAQVSNAIVEIDRGRLISYACDYETFLERRESYRLSEDKQQALFEKRLSDEETWIRTGVKARRTRNEGRVRALKTMREAYKQRRLRLGNVKSLSFDVARAGNIVVEATNLQYSIDNNALIRDFSLLLTRGDKIGIIGPNGCGKTTLVRLLLGELKPDSGQIKQGTAISVAYFDQLRVQLDETQTVMASVADGADYVTLGGKTKHVAAYLRDFLFSSERFNQPISSLSGGERNRLLLARLFAKPFNLLVLDEPTNDLDIETLELLETMLIDYPGTLLLISHDRAFIDQVVTSVLVYEADGLFHEYVGGYDDYRVYKQQLTKVSAPAPQRQKLAREKLTFSEQRELAQLPKQIELLEQEILLLQSDMAQPQFYQQQTEHIAQKKQLLTQQEQKLATLYARWEFLEAKGGG